jgi:integrase
MFLEGCTMSGKRKTVPLYQHHLSSGRARVRTYDATGKRVEIFLPGKFGSKESKDAYADLLKRLQAGGGVVPGEAPVSDITVEELVSRYLREHVEIHYRAKDGTPTSEKASIINAVKPLVRLIGPKAASEVTPLDLRAYRETVISGRWRTPEEEKARKQKGRQGKVCRRTVNSHVGRIKRMFRWAASLSLVPPAVIVGLDALPGLERGRSDAKDHPPVQPVALADAEATAKHAPEIIADVIHVQLYSGCRAGELLNARTRDIDQEGPGGCWILRPEQHKGTWRGHSRNILFGPKCQLILRRYLTPDEPERFLFRPCDTAYAKARPQSKFKDHYSVDEYDQAIGRAAERAGVRHWSSHDLRRLAARQVERKIGLESARQFLGHKGANLTAMYSGLDIEAAAEVARRVG